MSSPGGTFRSFAVRLGASAALLALSLTGSAAALAPSHRAHVHHGFPVPSCRWIGSSLIEKTLGVRVRFYGSEWTTQIAPVLTCAYSERQPQFQFGGAPIVVVQFHELQRFSPELKHGWSPLKGLGSCLRHSSCPASGAPPASQIVQHSTLAPPNSTGGSSSAGGTTTAGSPTSPSASTTTPTTTTTTTTGPATPVQFVSGVGLRVEDGLNFLAIVVTNPYGPLPVPDEIAGVHRLARTLLPDFRWK